MEITFNKLMLGGSPLATTGHMFLVHRNGGAYPYVAHRIRGGYAISHLPTGRLVERCTATHADPVTLDEAITGFRTQIDIGVTDPASLEQKAAEYEVINADWQVQAQKRSEGVRAFTEMSSVHLRPEDLQAVGILIAGDEWESGYSGPSGVLVWRGYKDSQFCPDVLKNILIHLDTDCVLFDRDAPTHSRFPEFAELWD